VSSFGADAVLAGTIFGGNARPDIEPSAVARDAGGFHKYLWKPFSAVLLKGSRATALGSVSNRLPIFIKPKLHQHGSMTQS
jgi:hypothetical protein